MLKISPARAAEVYGLGHVPWEMKSLFGMMSDAWPIWGYRRAPYCVIFGGLGTVAWLWLGFDTSLSASNLAIVGLLLYLGNLSQAGPDGACSRSLPSLSSTSKQRLLRAQ